MNGKYTTVAWIKLGTDWFIVYDGIPGVLYLMFFLEITG